MPLLRQFSGSHALGTATAVADTLIKVVVPPKRGRKTYISQIKYRAGTTSHLMTLMRCIGRSATVANAAASQAVVVLKADPGATSQLFPGSTGTLLVSGHYVAIRYPDDTLLVTTVSGAPTLASNGNLSVTLATNLVYATAPGAEFWQFGVLGSIDPRTGLAHPRFNCYSTSVATVAPTGMSQFFDPSGGPFFGTSGCGGEETSGFDEPIMVQFDNITNAGLLEFLTYGFEQN